MFAGSSETWICEIFDPQIGNCLVAGFLPVKSDG